MNIQNKLKILDDELVDMSQHVKSENRNPYEFEKFRATKILREIKELEQEGQKPQPALTLMDGDLLDNKYEMRGSDNNMDTNKKNEFKNDGDFFRAVAHACVNPGTMDKRLESRAASGMGIGIPSDGGFLVGEDFSKKVLTNIWDNSDLLKRCFRIPVKSNTVKIPRIVETSRTAGNRMGGIRGYWGPVEAGQYTKSKPGIGMLELNLNKLTGLCYATEELLEDQNLLGTILQKGFEDEFQFLIQDAIVAGSGAGMPLGAINSGGTVSVGIETGQAANSIVAENIFKMWSRLIPSSQKNSAWLVNNDCLPQLFTMSVAVGTGGAPIYLPANGAADAPFGTILGRPLLAVEQAKSIGNSGDIMLCDFTNGYIIAEKSSGMRADISVHYRFINGEAVYRFQMRLDGQPVLGSPITPANGSNTLSHMVKLDART